MVSLGRAAFWWEAARFFCTMPYRTFDLKGVANYLHLSRTDVELLMRDSDIPFEKRGERLVFQKTEIDTWASKRILGLESRPLAEYHKKTSRSRQEQLAQEALIPQMMRPEFIDPALPAKTKASVLREMAALAVRTDRVWDPEGLVKGLSAREELCSTGLPGGLALLHTRQPDEHMFESPFIVLGRTVQQIPFGAPDGRPTDLFFLLASPDDRLHLHTLARLCLLAQKTDLLAGLRAAADAEEMYQCLVASEQVVLEGLRSGRT